MVMRSSRVRLWLLSAVVGCGGAAHTSAPAHVAAEASEPDLVSDPADATSSEPQPAPEVSDATPREDAPRKKSAAPAAERDDVSSLMGSATGGAAAPSFGGGLLGSGGGGAGASLGYGAAPRSGKGGAPPPKAAPREAMESGRLGGWSGAAITAPELKAGRHDDNKEYNRFLTFLAEHKDLVVLPVDISERLVVRVVDKDAKSLPNCVVRFAEASGRVLTQATTFADGKVQFFPAAVSVKDVTDYVAKVKCPGVPGEKSTQLARSGRREVEVRFPAARVVPTRVPVDVAIVFDSTGSMQSQIDRLKKTVRAIHFQLTQLPTKPDIRFALVDYRDQGDDFVTRVTPFTRDVVAYQRAVDAMVADGGGDTPEDLQSALKDAFALDWRDNALRLGFIITDAAPHTDYGQAFDYRVAMQEGLVRGIKWTSIGVGGLGIDGEVIYRQISQYTMGEYVFVTESASRGDSAGGVGEASHHVGANYTKENLDQAIVRIVRRELSYLTDTPKDLDDTIQVASTKRGDKDVLKPAVDEVIRQLADYSALQLTQGTPLAVVPVTAEAAYKDVGGYLTDQLTLSASRNPSFRLVERDLSVVAQELKLQLTELFDVTQAVPIGQLVGAEVLLVTKLVVRRDGAELFAKLVRVATGEVLSVARVEMGAGVLEAS